MANKKNIIIVALLTFCLAPLIFAADNTLMPPNLSMLQKNDGSFSMGAKPAVTGIAAPSSALTPASTPSTISAADQSPQTTDTQGHVSEDISNQAFLGVLNKQLPMTPEQIANLHKAFDETQRAASAPPDVPPRPTTSSVLVNLSPSAVPPIIRLGAGYISSLVFVDSTGQPWPIEAYSVGDPGSFNIQWDKKGNTLLVQATSFYKRSNLAVILKGLNTPVMITLLPGQTAVDYRVDLRIPGAGPNAIFLEGALPAASDPQLLNVLNGVPPTNARTLKVIGDDNTRAWLVNNTLYVRTPLVIISPAWRSIMTSIDGTHAYQLQPSSVLLSLQRGKDKILKLTLEGLE
jgi:intracellular multiplication protein IcmK